MDALILELFNLEIIKFGDFKLKNGLKSPIYIDLRTVVSYPTLLEKISKIIYQQMFTLGYDIICGVPYTALPIATYISIQENIPMVMRRKETKNYGTKKKIEGNYKQGDKCLIIEDVVTSGSSVLDTYRDLRKERIVVKDIIVFIDREQGGEKELKRYGIKLHSCLKLTDILYVLKKHKKISNVLLNKVMLFLNNPLQPKTKRLSYNKRSKMCKNPISKRLFEIMFRKKTNLCLSLDLTKTTEIIKMIHICGDDICLLKLHYDIIDDFNMDFINELKKLAYKYNFMIFEDRKFADIGSTVSKQFEPISKWCDITNCHILPGDGVIKGLKKSAKSNGLLLLAEMSSKGNLLTKDYKNKCIEYARKYDDFVIGFISMSKITDEPHFIHMTPGVNLKSKGDKLGQQYKTPEEVIRNGSDIIIVGRGIYNSTMPKIMAMEYKNRAWRSYQKLIL